MSDTWRECYDRWLNSRRSLATRRAYAADVAAFLEHAGCDLSEVGPSTAAAWAERLRAEGSPATVCRRLAAVSSLYRYAAQEFGMAVMNPFAAPSLRPRVSPYGKSHVLSMDEVRLMLGRIRMTSPIGWRDKALIEGLFITARRVSEWLGLRGRDLHLEGGGRVVFEVVGKGEKLLRQTMPAGLWRTVQGYLRLDGRWPLGSDAFVFAAAVDGRHLSSRMVGDVLRRYGDGIAAEKLHPHALRHAGAHARRDRGAGALELKALLNHSNLAVTQIYIESLLDVPDDPLGEMLVRELEADM